MRTLLQTASGTFKQLGFESIDTYHGGHGEVPFYQSFVGDYNRDGKPDVMLISADENEHPQSADVLLNTHPKPDGTCQAPAPVGIPHLLPYAQRDGGQSSTVRLRRRLRSIRFARWKSGSTGKN